MINRRHLTFLYIFFASMLTSQGNGQDTLAVTANGFSSYLIDGVPNPTLTLIRGNTYVFQINTPGHPFWIKTQSSTGTENSFSTGVTGGGTSSGFLIFAVPESAPDQLFYNCEFHISMTGMINISSTVLIDDEPAVPAMVSLAQNYPNPFNPSTRIEFSLRYEGKVDIAVYSPTGTIVRQLFQGEMDPGKYSIVWDGRDELGQPVGSGIYLYRLESNNLSITRKMSLVK